MKFVAWPLPCIVVLYLLLIGAVAAFQRDMEYPGAHRIGRVAEVAPLPWKSGQLDVPGGGPLTVWQVRPARSFAPTIVLFPGNDMGTLSMLPLADQFRQQGYGVVLGAYRGYSGNPGSSSEAGLIADGQAAASLATKDGPAILLGHSLGAGVAAAVAANNGKMSGLILSAPSTSAVNIMARRLPILPIRHLLLDQYDILEKIAQIHCPVLLLHGDADRAIPLSESQQIAEAFGNQASLVIVRGGDHDSIWLDGFGAAQQFVSRIEAAAAPPPPASPVVSPSKQRSHRKHAPA